LANPLRYVDPSGLAIETPWDIANVVIGAGSFAHSVATGDIAGAVVDGLGLVYDGFATVVPGLPAGAGATINAYRAGTKAARAMEWVRSGNKITGDFADALRSKAREAVIKSGGNIAEAISKNGSKMEVHHLVPLEWAHKMGKDFDPNAPENLVGMMKGDHTEVTKAWGEFKKQFGDGAKPEQIQKFTQSIEKSFGDKMVKDVPKK